MKYLFSFLLLLAYCKGIAQLNYTDSLKKYQMEYVSHHPLASDIDTDFLSFYSVNDHYCVVAAIEKNPNSPWFNMVTSGLKRPLYRVYAVLSFMLNGKPYTLNLYQSQSLLENEQYKNYLFLPFTDETSGHGSYEGGRYIDFTFDDIKEGRLLIDFNKAYNPYCAYVSGKYNCPIPPIENNLPVKIEAGEKEYGKH
jgi:uncharacterized protein